ncbi:MAG: peptidoglycan-associated lipoprotein Pal [Candidatus Rokuibacteriota bacterium]|nr:MAG: peptidoglycan-associated lipoprotein Pal [Candidatus Rokubacteria bacterium]
MRNHFSTIALVSLLTVAPILAGCAAMSSSDGSAQKAGGSTDGSGLAAGAADGGRGGSSSQMYGNPARPNPKEFTRVGDLKDIHFDFDRYDIRPEDAQLLEANAETLKANPSWALLIEGHTDQRGTTEYNMALADRRARASMHYLVSLGVRSTRIAVISYGKERPTCATPSEDCWSQNRRAHFLVKAQ